MSSTIEKVKDILHINKDKNATDTSKILQNNHPQSYIGSRDSTTTDFNNMGASHHQGAVPRHGQSEHKTGYIDPSENSSTYDPQASNHLEVCLVTDDESDAGCGLTPGRNAGRNSRKSKSPSNTGSNSSCFLNKLDPRSKPAPNYSDKNFVSTPIGTSLARDNRKNEFAETLDPRFASHRDNRPPPIDYHDTAQVPPSVFIPLNGEGKKGNHARRKSVVTRPE
ncbi:hypothetical protein BGHDH14_bgh00951 [Blumeria hordei DH14]|uniref:Uncharacterized protein n=1 Tax=Blumeria graminis f. sp. hordei (strain DH14) TaxID=546991 RepID=N1JH30_BLUG1|nr:hypothetical protein BGHDH14_bgh00951 [Blumeria hordei DH14]